MKDSNKYILTESIRRQESEKASRKRPYKQIKKIYPQEKKIFQYRFVLYVTFSKRESTSNDINACPVYSFQWDYLRFVVGIIRFIFVDYEVLIIVPNNKYI
ncbi:hypothetical protein RCL_jg13820.t1 [Rhizophagus clarus]|uniref:Uncharacterized protein n=1 Tax=Rhizophagus clarus TaxID=94130 RepID=A0A8H3QU63_9GLOM|nr:hypothetical protein RCL_jg13820.t1 [Rhizophagus clarus]